MEKELTQSRCVFWDDYYPYLRTLLLTSSRQHLQSLFLFSEGIEKHLQQCAQEESTWDGFLNAAVTYRYTASRIRRTCLQAVNQVSAEEALRLKDSTTMRILAFNDSGRIWLKELKKHGVSPAVRFADIPEAERELTYRTSLLYTSVLSEEERRRILDLEIRGARYIK